MNSARQIRGFLVKIFATLVCLQIFFCSVTSKPLPVDYDILCDKPAHLPLPTAIHWGDFKMLQQTVHRILSTKGGIILMLGGSITGDRRYYKEFQQFILQEYNVRIVNRAHGSTDLLYALYCIQIEDVNPDIVFLEYKINDNKRLPEEMEALIRRIRRLPSHPLVVILNFALVKADCSDPISYLSHAVYYGLPLIDLCAHIHHCYGKDSTHRLYTNDGGHPRGPKGHVVPSGVLIKWWKTVFEMTSTTNMRSTDINSSLPSSDSSSLSLSLSSSASSSLLYNHSRPDSLYSSFSLPSHLYQQSLGDSDPFCECLNDDSPSSLLPIHTAGFVNITRTKFGERGFSAVKRCWEGHTVGASISFSFHGMNLMVAVYQNASGMGVAEVYLDQEKTPSRNVSGYFKGYAWRRGGGRQDILPLYENLADTQHSVTFRITDMPSNPLAPGHNFQIIALLYSSSIRSRKKVI